MLECMAFFVRCKGKRSGLVSIQKPSDILPFKEGGLCQGPDVFALDRGLVGGTAEEDREAEVVQPRLPTAPVEVQPSNEAIVLEEHVGRLRVAVDQGVRQRGIK